MLLAVLVVSVLLHALLLGWLAGGAGLPGERTSGDTIDVSLIGGEAIGALQGVVPKAPAPVPAVPAAPAAPAPRPAVAPRPVPRPNAITNAPADSPSAARAAAEAARRAAEAARIAAEAAGADPLAQAGSTGAAADDDEDDAVSGDAGEVGAAAARAGRAGQGESAGQGGQVGQVGQAGQAGQAGQVGQIGQTWQAEQNVRGPGADVRPAERSASAGERAGTPDEHPASAADQATTPAAPRSLLFGSSLPPPAAGHWKFRVFYGDFSDSRAVASLDYSIELDGRRYRLRTEGRAEGLTALIYSGVLTQSSTGRLSDNGLMPEHYSEQRGKRAERHADVDWTRGEVRFSDGGTRAAPVPGMQDRLSALVQLGLIARAAPERFAGGLSIDVPELSMKGVVATRYRSHGPKVLETPDGVLQTIHLERVLPRNPNDPRIEIWLGRDHQLLPVRVRLTDENGRVLDQLLAR